MLETAYVGIPEKRPLVHKICLSSLDLYSEISLEAPLYSTESLCFGCLPLKLLGTKAAVIRKINPNIKKYDLYFLKKVAIILIAYVAISKIDFSL